MNEYIKKLTKKLIICLVLSSTITITPSTSQIITSDQSFSYLPILSYQRNLYDKMADFIAYYFYATKPEIKKITIPTNQINQNHPKISRDEAIHKIKQTTSKIFDVQDPENLSVHLNTMVDLTRQLDPQQDKKTITAIHFLLENQHRSSILDTLFWIKNIKEKELDTAIPMTTETASKSSAEKLSTLRKKMALAAA